MWIDVAYVRNLIGTSQCSAVGVTTSGGVLSQFEAEARSVVSSLLTANGYTAPGSTLGTSAASTPFLRKLVGALVVRDLYGFKKGVRFPPSVQDGISILAAYENGEGKRFPVPGMSQDTAAGVGGTSVTPTDSWDGGEKPLTFARQNTRGL